MEYFIQILTNFVQPVIFFVSVQSKRIHEPQISQIPQTRLATPSTPKGFWGYLIDLVLLI